MSQLPPDPVDNLKNWASLFVQNTERAMSKSLLVQLLSQTRAIDRFSGWFLLLVGATFAMVVPHIETVTKLISPAAIKTFLIFFIISALCGIAQKFYALSVDMRLRLAEGLEKEWTEHMRVAEEEEKKIQAASVHWKASVNTSLDIYRIMAPLLEVFPRWLKNGLTKKMESGLKDSLSSYKGALREFMHQSVWLLVQFIFLLAGAVVVALNIKNG